MGGEGTVHRNNQGDKLGGFGNSLVKRQWWLCSNGRGGKKHLDFRYVF